MGISRERIDLALSRMDYKTAFEFEAFASGFLASEFPDLRPVGGMGDGGQDGFLYGSEELPDTFVQCSISKDWKSKIRQTIARLQDTGKTVRELIYCTNQDIQKISEEFRVDLRRSMNIRLDIRDRPWFVMFANTSVSRQELAEDLARKFVDPLLSDQSLLTHSHTSLTSDEERVLTAYLQIELSERVSTQGLTKHCFDSLVIFSLRNSTPDNTMPRADIHKTICTLVSSRNKQHVISLVDAALVRLRQKGKVKYYPQSDSYTLAYVYREEIRKGIQQFLSDRVSLTEEVSTTILEVSRQLDVDFEFEAEAVAVDVLSVLDYIVFDRSRLAALALTGRGTFFGGHQDIYDITEGMVVDGRPFQSISLIGKQHFLDLVPYGVLELVRNPSHLMKKRLREVSDAYCLLFSLRETPDVQKAMRQVFYAARILVDTNVIVPCLAERLKPESDRHLSRIMRAAHDAGMRIFVGDDVLNELETHLERVRNLYRQGQTAGVGFGGLISAYEYSRGRIWSGSFSEFIDLFIGPVNPKADLIDYLWNELRITYDEMLAERRSIDRGELEHVVKEWKMIRNRKEGQDEDIYDMLVRHDVMSYLLIDFLRSGEKLNYGYGPNYWWLTIDRAGYRYDQKKKGERRGRGLSICMSPDFFVRFLSLSPKGESADRLMSDSMSVCLELAGLGLVPVELKEEARKAYTATEGLPGYIRRRKLRDLLAKAREEKGEFFDSDDPVMYVVGMGDGATN